MIKIYEYAYFHVGKEKKFLVDREFECDTFKDTRKAAESSSRASTGFNIVVKFVRITDDAKLEYAPIAGEGYRDGKKFDWEKEFPEWNRPLLMNIE